MLELELGFDGGSEDYTSHGLSIHRTLAKTTLVDTHPLSVPARRIRTLPLNHLSSRRNGRGIRESCQKGQKGCQARPWRRNPLERSAKSAKKSAVREVQRMVLKDCVRGGPRMIFRAIRVFIYTPCVAVHHRTEPLLVSFHGNREARVMEQGSCSIKSKSGCGGKTWRDRDES